MTSAAATPLVTDWITASATVVAAVGGLAGFSALIVEVRRSRGARLRPPEGLLTVLQDFSVTFSEITVAGQGRRMTLDHRQRMRFEQSRHFTTEQAAPGHGVPGRVFAVNQSGRRRTAPV
jgi:hypothetical protein